MPWGGRSGGGRPDVTPPPPSVIPPPQGVTLTELKEAEKAIGRIGEEQPIREGERREEQPPESTVGGGGGRDGCGGVKGEFWGYYCSG